MATNPMQRQARNSFLLGMIITLIIAGVIVYLLFSQIKKLNKQLKDEKDATVSVYVAKQDIKSGQTVTADLFVMKTVKKDGVPADATSNISAMIQNYSLCDKSGNDIYTDAEGNLYMTAENGGKTTVYIDDATGNYYTQAANNGQKNYIETTQKPLVAKVDLKANTVIASSYVARSDELTTDDVRNQEYNMLVLPVDVITGDFVDVRLQLPTGQDYIVISKKKVTVPQVNGDVAKLIDSDPNIVSKARTELANRYNNGSLKDLRNQYINGALSNYGKDENVSTKMTESITSTQESRKQYLQSLTGTATSN